MAKFVSNPGEFKESPSQTAGPYVHIGTVPNHLGTQMYGGTDLGSAMTTGPVRGEEITVIGTVTDGTGTILRDALVEIWQADASGVFPSAEDPREADPNFTGWGRCACDWETGEFRFETVKPGRVPWVNGALQAPHISFWIVARGINTGLHTRMYFAEEETANAEDPILTKIEHKHRIPTLMAQKQPDGHYRFDIRIQGGDETVFFDI